MPSICVGCGMCCDGTMYGTTDLSEGDQVDLLRSSGFAFTTTDEVTSFQQPCSAFRSGQCVVYEGRPSVCRKYRCLLLRRYEAGEVSHGFALALIGRTISLRDRVRSALKAIVDPKEPQTLGGLCRLALAKCDAMPDQVTGRREHAELLLDIAVLRVALCREFEPRDSEGLQSEDIPADAPR